MPSLGPAEILVILVVALLVFGPNKMPEIGRQVARGVREFRRVQQHLSNELQSVVSDLDPTAPAAPAPASSGGDPVPTLPPRDTTVEPAADAEPARPPEPVDSASAAGADTPTGLSPATPVPPIAASEPDPRPQPAVPGSIGETPPPSPPAEPA
jgi:sec-independent protein translocase protein TatA